MNAFQICTLHIKTQDKPKEGWGSELKYCIWLALLPASEILSIWVLLMWCWVKRSPWQKIVLSLLLPWVNWEGLLCFHPLLPPLWHPVCLQGWCLPSPVLTRVGNLSSCLPAFSFHLRCWNRPLGLNRTTLLPMWLSSPSRPTVCPDPTPLLPKCIPVMFSGNRRVRRQSLLTALLGLPLSRLGVLHRVGRTVASQGKASSWGVADA